MSNNKSCEELLSVQTMHGTFKTCAYTPSFRQRKAWQPANPKHLLSFIPSTIIGIEVKVGDEVSPGDVLLRFKAMKMDNTIKAETAGRIKAIHIAAGDKVAKGVLMMEFE